MQQKPKRLKLLPFSLLIWHSPCATSCAPFQQIRCKPLRWIEGNICIGRCCVNPYIVETSRRPGRRGDTMHGKQRQRFLNGKVHASPILKNFIKAVLRLHQNADAFVRFVASISSVLGSLLYWCVPCCFVVCNCCSHCHRCCYSLIGICYWHCQVLLL